MLGHVFDRTNAHGRQGERDAKFFRGTCGQNFAISVLHANHASGRNRYGHGHVLADHGAGGAAAFHIDRHALAKFDFLKIIFIGAVGAFGPAA